MTSTILALMLAGSSPNQSVMSVSSQGHIQLAGKFCPKKQTATPIDSSKGRKKGKKQASADYLECQEQHGTEVCVG